MRQQSQQNIYYMTNHLGHVYGVFDQAGERLSQRGYSPYGQVSGDYFTLQPFGMSTKRSDFTSGIVYFGYRFYIPSLGRWLNRDPLQEQGGINLYAYVDGDPLGYVDPDGRYKSRPYNPSPTDHLIYPPQKNSQCYYDCYEKAKAAMSPRSAVMDQAPHNKSLSCKQPTQKWNVFDKEKRSAVQDLIEELYAEVSCDIECSLNTLY
ncbi:RHS repeat domain-containing protein [Vibrio sp. MED222]|nr:RHS repeat-associated core domain-containing protein [Vibrio sp. MED222]EAQ55983.1 putative rhs-related protein [Vibrio sp. MED222]